MKVVDYYKVMDVPEDASLNVIKKAYRRLARKYHPDVSSIQDAEEKFKQVGEAYEVLKDPDKRAEYDSLRKFGAFANGEFKPPPTWQSRGDGSPGSYSTFDPNEFSDFFRAVYGRAGYGDRDPRSSGAAYTRRGDDLHAQITVSLAEEHILGSSGPSQSIQST